jgi:N-acetylneuraminic acid mutarotase
MLVFGGYDGNYFNDLWSYKATNGSWSQLFPNGPTPPTRRDHTAVYDTVSKQMFVFGGYNPGLQNDLWAYQTQTNTWTQLSSGPSGRAWHTAIWDPVNYQMLVFGGWDGSDRNDLWSFRPQSGWGQLLPSGTRPGARSHAVAVWDPLEQQMLLFGGEGSSTRFNDLWSYKPSTNSWAQLNPGGVTVPALSGATAVWDTRGSQMLVFGGVSGFPFPSTNDLWAYQPSTNVWSNPIPSGGLPSTRDNHAAVWNQASNQLLVHGGYHNGFLNDLWRLQ